MLLPIILRFFIKMQGEIRKRWGLRMSIDVIETDILRSDIELKLFTRFWLFQVIHGFLVVTLASGLISSLANIKNTSSSVPTLLATNLPNASIFFLTL